MSSLCPACDSGKTSQTCKVYDHEYGLDFEAVYASCEECGTLFQLPMPSPQELTAFYPPSYHSFSGNSTLNTIRMNMRLKRLTRQLRVEGAILDYGCGAGQFLLHVAKSLPDRKCFGYEIGDKDEITTACNGRVVIVRGAVEQLWGILPPLAIATLNHVVEHLPCPSQDLSEIAKKLTPGGVLEGQTPASDSLERKLFGTLWSGFHAPRHTVVFSRSGLTKTLENLGLADIKISAAFNPAAAAVSFGSLSHGNKPGRIPREGLPWLFLLGLGTAFAPLDLLLGPSGIIDFSARKIVEK